MCFLFYNWFAISEFACRREINSEISITVNTFDAVIINVKAGFVLLIFYTFVGKLTFVFFGFMESNQWLQNFSIAFWSSSGDFKIRIKSSAYKKERQAGPIRQNNWVRFIPTKQKRYSWLPITRTLANSNLTLTRTKIDFPWISVIHSL